MRKEYNMRLKEEDLRKYIGEVFEKSCIDYDNLFHHRTFNNPISYKNLKTFVNEGLIKIYPIDKTMSYIKDFFKLEDWQISIIDANGDVKYIGLIIPNIGENIEMVRNAMNYCGWYLGYPKNINREDFFVQLQFEPKYIENIRKELNNTCKTLIHITPLYNIRKIQKIGLSPKIKNELFNYPNRIYFVKDNTDINIIKNLTSQLSTNNSSLGNNGEYCLITIDLDKVPDNVGFYYDGNFPNGVYTTSNINPKAITSIEKINLF